MLPKTSKKKIDDMVSHAQYEELTLEPLKKDLRGYSTKTLLHDMWAGLSVSLLSIPQALAYSIVVGLPAFCGLATIMFGTALAALLGSSRHLIMGPNNASVLLVQGALASIMARYHPNLNPSHHVEVVLPIIASLVFFVGLFQLMAARLKLGGIIQFVSQSVVVGYIAGAAFALTLDQLFPFLGIALPMESGSLYETMVYLISHINHMHLPTALVGIMSITIYVTVQKMNLKIPTSLLMILIVTAIIYSLDVHSITDAHGVKLQTVGSSGGIEAAWPSLRLPAIDIGLLNMFLPSAFAIALFGMLETISLSKTIAASSGQRVHANQEICGLGASNMLVSFFGALPCSSSISRTYLNYDSGAKTRFAALFSSLFVAAIVFFFQGGISYIPVTALAAQILVTALRMVDMKQLRLCLRATHSDASVLVTTFLACIFFSLHIAFYIGVVVSIALYLRKAASPEVVEYSYDDDAEELRPTSEAERRLKKKVRIINVEGELFFGAVDLFQSALKAIAEDDTATKVFILRLKHVRDLDATACLALRQLYEYLRKGSRYLIVSSIPYKVWLVLEKARLVEYLGKDNLLIYDEARPRVAIEKALERAKTLLAEAPPVPVEEVVHPVF